MDQWIHLKNNNVQHCYLLHKEINHMSHAKSGAS